jgi:Ca2+-binding RTX toxin-like protein
MTVDGGAGSDTIATGGSKDTITPGPGNDTVRSGGDVDRVIADSTPDGNDLLELGTGSVNAVDDSARTKPLHLAGGVLGTGGEEDRFTGMIEVIGGSGNDEFHSIGEFLKGGPGDDTLTGSPGDDYIFGGTGNDLIRGEAGEDDLYGGEGDDTVFGGAGNDMIEEREEDPKGDLLLETRFEPSGGNDVIEAGEGDDFVLAGPGEDRVEGGLGNDRLYGESGNDTIEGGAGNDEVAGDEGADVLRGGEGDDKLLSAYNKELLGYPSSGEGVDVGVDSLDCGPGNDGARTNVWDEVENCEQNQIARAVMVKKVRHNRAKGTATLSFRAYASKPVTVEVAGKGIKPLSYSPSELTYFEKQGTLAIRPTSTALAKLGRRGHLQVTLRLTWAPAGTATATETRKLNLVLQKKPARHHRGPGGR